MPKRSLGLVLAGALTGLAGPVWAQGLPVQMAITCAEGGLSLSMSGERAELLSGDVALPLRQEPAASGMRMVAEVDPDTWVWTKGDEVTVRLAGRELSACAVSGMTTVTGAPWTVTEIAGAPVTGTAPDLLWDEEGGFTGSGGCNRFTGSWGPEGPGPLAATRMACPEPVMAQEQALFAALARVTGLRLDAQGGLDLRAGDEVVIRARR